MSKEVEKPQSASVSTGDIAAKILDGGALEEFPGTAGVEIGLTYVTRGLPGSRDKHKHHCWGCSQAKVPFGVLVPFLQDVAATFGETISWASDREGLHLAEGDRPLLAINSFALYCNTGDSVKLIARLTVTAYTVDGAHTMHTWEAAVPNPSFMQRRKGDSVLVPEVRQLLNNELYAPNARVLLLMLMQHLCVGTRRLHKISIQKLREAISGMPDDLMVLVRRLQEF